MSGFDETPNNPTGYTSGPASSTPNDAFAGSAASSSYASASADPYTANVPPAYGPAGSVPPPYTAPGYTPTAGLPNPGLATLLGFIPGVGAMYNGQFAKGIAHVVIFAVLVSLSDHVNGIFGLLVAGWVFYMVFDAYQTARARRDGLVAPDPFGLNNIGEKFGIGNGPNWSDFTARPAPGAVPPTQAPPPTGYTDYRDTTTTHAAAASGAPAYQGGVTPGVNDVPYQAVAGASGTAAAYAAPYSGYAAPPSGYAAPPYAAAPPYPAPSAPYGSAYAPPIPPLPPLSASGSTLPTGAIWLIGFGVFALLGTLSHRFYWSNRYLDGAIVAAVGIVLLVTRTLRARGVYPAGSAANTWYLLRTSRVGLILLAIGTALTLDHAGALTWNYLWPYLLILLGTFLLVERAAHNRMLAAGPIPAEGYAPYAPPPTGDTAETSATPSFIPRDEEGRQP